MVDTFDHLIKAHNDWMSHASRIRTGVVKILSLNPVFWYYSIFVPRKLEAECSKISAGLPC